MRLTATFPCSAPAAPRDVYKRQLCYMAGYGVQDASLAMVGQAVGAHRRDMAKRIAWPVSYTHLQTITQQEADDAMAQALEE